MTRHLWRFDLNPELRALIRAEAAALGVGRELVPGLYLGERPFDPTRAGYAVGGGELLAEGPPGSALPLPPGTERLHVARGPFKTSGNPADIVRALRHDLRPAPRGHPLELYACAERWLVVRVPPYTRYRPPELPYRTSTGLSSQLARALVNLVARPGDRFLDPVCGTGVVLVEAAAIGCTVEGSDINRKACWNAQRNLSALNLPGRVQVRDALLPAAEDELRWDVLVGDLPYGRRLKPAALRPFAERLPARARRWLLVAHEDIGPTLREAGHPPRLVLRVPKPTFSRYVFVGGPELLG